MTNKVDHNANIYGKGNVLTTLLKLSFPIVIWSISQAAYQLVDSVIASNLVNYGFDSLGNEVGAAAAMTVITPIIIILFALTQLCAIGFSIKLSKALGEEDSKNINSTINSGFISFVIASMFVILFTFTLTKPFTTLMFSGSEFDPIRQDISSDTINYMYLSAITIIMILFQNTISTTLRAEGHIKAVSYLPLISIPINITLDIVFMHPDLLNTGLVGAAYASIIAETITIGLLLVAAFFFKKKNKTHLGFKLLKYKPNWKIVGGILLLGLTPTVLQILDGLITEMGAFLLKEAVPNDGGNYGNWVSWRGAVFSPLWLVLTSGVAVTQVGTSFISYNVGAKNRERVNKGIGYSFLVFLLYTVTMAIIVSSLSYQILELFNVDLGSLTSPDGSGHNFGDEMIIWFIVWMFVSILSDFIYEYNDFTNAIGKPKIAMGFVLVNTLLIMIPTMLTFFFIFKDQGDQFHLFLLWYPVYSVLQLLIIGSSFSFVCYKNNKVMKKEWKN